VNNDIARCGRVKGRAVSGFFMKPKLLSWDMRGLNEGGKQLRVKNLLR
jgi:hypothetical protein